MSQPYIPELGLKGRVDKILVRAKVPLSHKPAKYVFWDRTDQEERVGVLIGIRRLSNGTVLEEGGPLTDIKSVRAYLVAFDLKHNPVYVDPRDFKIWEY